MRVLAWAIGGYGVFVVWLLVTVLWRGRHQSSAEQDDYFWRQL